MTEIIGENQVLILSSILLALYSATMVLGLVRVAGSQGKNRAFLLKFYGLASAVSAIEAAIQALQVYSAANHTQIYMPSLIAINVYVMAFQAAAMFILSDYWGETSEILTKQSTEEQIQTERHWVRLAILSVWIVAFSAYIAYAFATHQLEKGGLEFYILILGCQGLGVALSLWANILQIVNGHKMSSALGRYQEWVSSVSIRKVKFCLLYWMSSILSLVRSLFLIVVSLGVELVQEEHSQYSWLFFFIYSFANFPIQVIYLMGFSNSQQAQGQTMLLDESRSSGRSARETELAPSRSSKSIDN